MAAFMIMQFSLNVAQCLDPLPAKFDDKIRKGSLDLMVLKVEYTVVFDFAMLYLGNGAR